MSQSLDITAKAWPSFELSRGRSKEFMKHSLGSGLCVYVYWLKEVSTNRCLDLASWKLGGEQSPQDDQPADESLFNVNDCPTHHPPRSELHILLLSGCLVKNSFYRRHCTWVVTLIVLGSAESLFHRVLPTWPSSTSDLMLFLLTLVGRDNDGADPFYL